MRAFIGIELPDEVRRALAQLQRELQAARADVKWVEPKNLHLTLKFLGEISEAQRQGVEACLKRIASQQPPFTLQLQGVGAFPSVESPRVVWVGIAQGKEEVRALAERIEQEATTLSLRQEERPFSAHLTLGRVRSPRNRKALAQRLRKAAWQPPGPFQVESITLFQSLLSSAGPTYTVLASIPLSLAGI